MHDLVGFMSYPKLSILLIFTFNLITLKAKAFELGFSFNNCELIMSSSINLSILFFHFICFSTMSYVTCMYLHFDELNCVRPEKGIDFIYILKNMYSSCLENE